MHAPGRKNMEEIVTICYNIFCGKFCNKETEEGVFHVRGMVMMGKQHFRLY
jgi:hypothetical protein